MSAPRSAQSSFTALVSTVALVGIISFCLVQVSGISKRVAYEERMAEAVGVAVAVSNDLLSNPGYNGTSLVWRSGPEHVGLAEYDSGRSMVLDHVLDREKIGFLRREGIGAVEKQYGVRGAGLVVETLSGARVLEIGNFSASRVQVTRLALLREGEGFVPVKLVFALDA